MAYQKALYNKKVMTPSVEDVPLAVKKAAEKVQVILHLHANAMNKPPIPSITETSTGDLFDKEPAVRALVANYASQHSNMFSETTAASAPALQKSTRQLWTTLERLRSLLMRCKIYSPRYFQREKKS